MDERTLLYIIPFLAPGANQGRNRLTGYYWVRDRKESDPDAWYIAHWERDEIGGWWEVEGAVLDENTIEIDPRPIRRMDADVLDRWHVLTKKNRQLMIIGWIGMVWAIASMIYSVFFHK